MVQTGSGEETGAVLRASPTQEIQREVGPICVTCQVLVEVVSGSSLRQVRWYQAGCPRSFTAEGVVRMTVYGPIHLSWRGLGCNCLRRTWSPGDKGPWSGGTASD
jgi:hypothetical protein